MRFRALPRQLSQPIWMCTLGTEVNPTCQTKLDGDFDLIRLANFIQRACQQSHERELTALKLAATEQATQAEAVLEERTRERDEAEQANELDRRSLFAVVRAIDEDVPCASQAHRGSRCL